MYLCQSLTSLPRMGEFYPLLTSNLLTWWLIWWPIIQVFWWEVYNPRLKELFTWKVFGKHFVCQMATTKFSKSTPIPLQIACHWRGMETRAVANDVGIQLWCHVKRYSLSWPLWTTSANLVVVTHLLLPKRDFQMFSLDFLPGTKLLWKCKWQQWRGIRYFIIIPCLSSLLEYTMSIPKRLWSCWSSSQLISGNFFLRGST